MRTIKFRGRSLNTNMWVYGDLQHRGNRAFVEYEVCPKSIGQFTGFKDKNNHEIYEGDVLRVTSLNEKTHGEVRVVEVIYSDKYAAFMAYLGAEKLESLFYQDSEIEIIGNIHNVPEQL